jgi:hypothetical protein
VPGSEDRWSGGEDLFFVLRCHGTLHCSLSIST